MTNAIPSTDVEVRVYRSRRQRIAAAVVGLIFLLCAIDIGFQGNGSGLGVVAVVALALGISVFTARAIRARVTAGDSGIRVKNLFGGFDLDWDEIQSFEIGRWRFLSKVCLITLRDGSTLHAWAIQVSNSSDDGAADRMVDELNETLSRQRSQA